MTTDVSPHARLAALAPRSAALDARTRELIGIAMSASAAHLHEPALRTHIRDALSLGVRGEEILEVLELVSVVGVHACTMAMPVLTEVAGRGRTEPTGRAAVVRDQFRAGRGMWPDFFEDMVALDPEFVAAYLNYSTVPWRRGNLSPKHRELIYIAIDANVTHLYETGTRLHIQNALRAGATAEEIRDVLRLAVDVGRHAHTVALPILRRLLDQPGD